MKSIPVISDLYTTTHDFNIEIKIFPRRFNL